jgi:hypothetical protein
MVVHAEAEATSERRVGMRKVRDRLKVGLPVLGTLLVFGAVVFISGQIPQIVVVLAGLLLLQAGVWQLANPLLPEDRKYPHLRQEVDHFMDLVRELNGAAAVEGGSTPPDAVAASAGPPPRSDGRSPPEIEADLRESLSRIVSAAGKSGGA